MCFSVNGKYADQGKLGAAVIGTHSACDVSVYCVLNYLVFIAARCYASAAYAIMRCLSVCVSVTLVHSVKTNSQNE